MPDQKIKARFIEPMLLLRTEKLPEGQDWLHELKFDGYRAMAIKSSGVVPLDENGRPSFNSLQNYGSAGAPLHFFIFDLLILRGRDLTDEPLVKRRQSIEKQILPKLADPIRYSPVLEGSLNDLIRSVTIALRLARQRRTNCA
jgi:bifunctional non-homologous end joining protein LigD